MRKLLADGGSGRMMVVRTNRTNGVNN